MARRFRLAMTALFVAYCFDASTVTAADLTPQQVQPIVQAAENIGAAVVAQGHSENDVTKLVKSYVENRVAQALYPNAPEQPLTASDNKQVDEIVKQVIDKLRPSIPVNPAPVPVPNPDKPAEPVKPSSQPGGNVQPGGTWHPIVVWVVSPGYAPQPTPAPIISPAPVMPGFVPAMPFPGAAPTIHIKHGWFGHPDKVWYSRH